MQPSREFVVRALWVTVLLAIGAVIFVYDSDWGAGMSAFAILAGLAIAFLGRTHGGFSRASSLCLSAALLFALMLSWRSAPELRFLNGLTMCLFAALGTLLARADSLSRISLGDVTVNLVAEGARWISSGVQLLTKDSRNTMEKESAVRQSGAAVARGLMVSLPLVFLFGGLLFSADASFERLVRSAFDFDATALGVCAMVFLVALVVTAGIARRLFVARVEAPPVEDARIHTDIEPVLRLKFGAIEACIVLGVLDALFLTFVALQLPYLFGGAAHIASTAHLSAAEYARRGFFELVAVVGLAIPMLIGLFALVKGATGRIRLALTGLTFAMVGCLVVVLGSAAQRMGIYIDLYGLSRLRVYVAAAMIWMALLLLWFVGTTARGRQDRFAFGGVAAFALVLIGLNACSPDAMVANWNTTGSRAANADTTYLASLSEDATPALVAAMGHLGKENAATILESRRKLLAEADWRSATLDHLLAAQSLSR